mgnify:CR=1 FL=1
MSITIEMYQARYAQLFIKDRCISTGWHDTICHTLFCFICFGIWIEIPLLFENMYMYPLLFSKTIRRHDCCHVNENSFFWFVCGSVLPVCDDNIRWLVSSCIDGRQPSEYRLDMSIFDPIRSCTFSQLKREYNNCLVARMFFLCRC